MARKLTITLPDELEAKIEAEAKARGTSVDAWALSVLSDAVLDVPRVPETQEDLEKELLKGLEGPGIPFTREELERRKAQLTARHTRSKAG